MSGGEYCLVRWPPPSGSKRIDDRNVRIGYITNVAPRTNVAEIVAGPWPSYVEAYANLLYFHGATPGVDIPYATRLLGRTAAT